MFAGYNQVNQILLFPTPFFIQELSKTWTFYIHACKSKFLYLLNFEIKHFLNFKIYKTSESNICTSESLNGGTKITTYAPNLD